jgi:hypothetical protein
METAARTVALLNFSVVLGLWLLTILLLFCFSGDLVKNNVNGHGSVEEPRRKLFAASLDPKSTEPKNVVPVAPDFNNLRFLYFGTSRTFGSGLPLSERTKLTFPALVSTKFTDRSVPAGSAEYPSRCLYSIMKKVEDNDSYDVIVLEFHRHFADTVTLAGRLRQRYPRSHIILLDLINLLSYTKDGKILSDWLRINDPSGTLEKALNTVGSATEVSDFALARINTIIKAETTSDQWNFRIGEILDKYRNRLTELDVKIISILPQNAHHDVERYASWFLSDMVHLSRKGHWHVARVILNNLHRSGFRAQHDATLGAWDEHDMCETWYSTGITSVAQENFRMNEFAPGKFALELAALVAYLEVENQEHTPQALSIQYMEASPDCRYPNVEVSILSDKSETMKIMCPTDSPYNHQVNVVRASNPVMIPPGESTVQFRNLEDGKPWPFRVVGIIMSHNTKFTVRNWFPGEREEKAWVLHGKFRH